METVQHNYTGYGSEGNLYQQTKEISTKEIAKIIRKELKSEIFEDFKFSIRSDYNHIRIEIIAVPNGFALHNPNYMIAYETGSCTMGISRFTDNAAALLDIIEKMLKKYNFSDCDGGIDYFNVKFYSNVSYDYSL